jgi:hypothetical protein
VDDSTLEPTRAIGLAVGRDVREGFALLLVTFGFALITRDLEAANAFLATRGFDLLLFFKTGFVPINDPTQAPAEWATYNGCPSQSQAQRRSEHIRLETELLSP